MKTQLLVLVVYFKTQSALILLSTVIYIFFGIVWKPKCRRQIYAAYHIVNNKQVAVLSTNVPAMYELHSAVPMAGAVLCTLNTRHDAAMVSVLLKHSGAKVLFVESLLLDVGRAALKQLA